MKIKKLVHIDSVREDIPFKPIQDLVTHSIDGLERSTKINSKRHELSREYDIVEVDTAVTIHKILGLTESITCVFKCYNYEELKLKENK